jgi:hypothetical protein
LGTVVLLQNKGILPFSVDKSVERCIKGRLLYTYQTVLNQIFILQERRYK